VLRPTSFIAEKVFGSIIAYGVKLMVLAFILSITFPMLQQLALPEEPNLLAFVNVFVGAAMLAFLCWHAPAIAASMLSASPSLSAQTISSGTSRAVRFITTGLGGRGKK
jgi:type IV secretion system protein TrbL